MKSSELASIVGIGIGTIAISWLTYRILRKRFNHPQPDPTKWQHIGALADINLLALKSCASVELETADCDEYGLTYKGFRNRSLLLLNEHDNMCFAGAYPQMLSIKSEILNEMLICLTAPNAEQPLILDLSAMIREGRMREKRMNDYRMELVECLAEHHLWFSRLLLEQDSGMRLFINLKTIQENCWWRETQSDFMPIMVMHNKSLLDLNSRLSNKDQVLQQQFRGNMLIESNDQIKAFDEDNWLWLKIGDDVILRFNSPCLRCILPNIDIFTCVRNANFEPLRTLKKYRLRSHPKEPEMGVYFDVYSHGQVCKGDSVYVQYK